jgi:hypothetical protein
MKLKFCASLLLGMLAFVAQAGAAHFDPFLAVDVNGYNAGGGQSIGPTLPGFQGWEMAEGLFLDPSIDWGASGAAGLSKVFGSVTANLIGVAPNSSRGARNRGANAGAISDLTSDFVFSQRDNAIAFGRHYNKLTLSGLTPGETYEFTGWAREPFNGGLDSFQAWTDLANLGGLDGPSAWLDANVAAGASYQPAPGGVNNPIPTALRSPTSGPDSADPFAYAASFNTTADASGVVTVYTWADPNSFSGVQGASLLNGFQLAQVPEPASLALCAFALVGVAIRRVR